MLCGALVTSIWDGGADGHEPSVSVLVWISINNAFSYAFHIDYKESHMFRIIIPIKEEDI